MLMYIVIRMNMMGTFSLLLVRNEIIANLVYIMTMCDCCSCCNCDCC